MTASRTAEPVDVPPASLRTILLVDDDAVVVKAMTVLLNRAGFETVGCQTAAAALACACPNMVAAILDVHLPDMNGLELSRQLRDRIGPAAPIVILSGDNSMQTIRRLPEAGATYFFAKPVNTGRLIEQLKGWTDGSGGKPA